ncbi:protoporphyrinogen oxidase [Mucor mucedo]|uniref:protoporphyrinogen oxidase n=1 Tax=Mucor mucedo TaxID=29922 RepID=UPI002220BF6A|nr:protoporphyrinogen oxidase [Mucor mucedo]KAI7885441.1 protoporphyrinogen oxidase [Mucor mucedo]
MSSSVAILGGGISGLSAAYYLSKASPKSKILVIEGSKRVGGWIRSQRVPPGYHSSAPSLPTDPNNVLFEVGPRSLRPVGPGGAAILSMSKDLELQQEMIFVSKTDPSAKNRYIYYQNQINTLPTSLSSLILNQPPVFKSVLKSIMTEPFVPTSTKDDESLYSLVARRFNDHVALNLVGAITHGIYAGDAKQLSVKSTMRILYEAEKRSGSVVRGMFGKTAPLSIAEQAMIDELDDGGKTTRETSVFGFKQGTETLVSKLRLYLSQQSNVTIITEKQVKKLTKNKNGDKLKIYADDTSVQVDHVISTIPSKKLNILLQKSLPNLSHNPSVDVAVINFAYDNISLKYNGFGFLTPHPDSHYKIPVPGTLGVVFDSNAMHGQEKNDKLVKLTVMMGGHMWNSAFDGLRVDQVDPEFVHQRASEALRVYLGIEEIPKYSMVNILPECIPQYVVGHEARLGELHQHMKQEYGHLLSVTGASYLGVSVPDCVKNSKLLVQDLLDTGALGLRENVVTGLNRVIQ